MRKRPLLWFACVFIVGLAYQKYAFLGCIAIVIVFLGIEVFYGIKTRNYKRMAGRSAILLSAFILGIAHMKKEEAFRNVYMSKLVEDSQITIWGEIIKTEDTEYGFRVYLSDCFVSLEGAKIPCNDVMVYALSDHFHVGEIHKIIGEFHRFKQARNEGNFDARIFYESQKIDFYLEEKESQLLVKSEDAIQQLLLSVKGKMLDVYDDCMEEKPAGFYKSLILGDKADLDKNLKEIFTSAGISHILAISGLHVSMIGRGFYKQLRKRGMGFFLSGLLAGAVLLAYGFMTGNSVSAQRAIGMLLISFLGQYMGRSYDMLNGLGGMSIILLLENPFLIEYTGFLFSVMALVGVGFVGENFSKGIKIGKGFWMSIGIFLSTLPLIAYCYFEVSIYSAVVNFLVLPLLTPMFCIALLGGVIGIFFPTVAKYIVLPSVWGFSLYEWICDFVTDLSGSIVITGKPTWLQITIYYVFLLVGVFLLRFLGKKRKLGICVIGLICFLLLVFPKEKSFEITFLDVGQGDGIYISEENGNTYFIDGGSTDVSGLGEYRILPFLKAKGVTEIDYWFVSHADMDHVSGLLEVLEKGYPIGCIVMAEACPRDENFELVLSAAQENGSQILFMKKGDQIVSKDVVFTCLYPEGEALENRNDASLVLSLERKEERNERGFSALFAGDISSEVETELLEEGVLKDVVLFKGIHHGSNYSNSEALLQGILPEIIVVSCGENNLYGHPGTEAVERFLASGADVFYTMENGQITVSYDEKKGLVIDGYLLLQ